MGIISCIASPKRNTWSNHNPSVGKILKVKKLLNEDVEILGPYGQVLDSLYVLFSAACARIFATLVRHCQISLSADF